MIKYTYQINKEVYIKLHQKGGTINQQSKSNPQYAIVMLCMLKEHYVFGACISAFAHKFIMKKANIDNISLVIMCDKIVYENHSNLLRQFFDDVIEIELDDYKISKKYKFSERWINKYKWIVHSTSKWQCLNFTNYDKILFIDIDILPISHKFYNIFLQKTPSFKNFPIPDNDNKQQYVAQYNCVDNEKVVDPLYNITSYKKYTDSDKQMSLNGGIVLLKPDKEVYKKYKNFIDEMFGQDGIFARKRSGPDETSLFYFYTKIMPKKKFYRICKKYAVVPWDAPKRIPDALAINYLSYVKPWLKPIFCAWEEEMLWRDIYEAIPKNKELDSLFKKVILMGYDIFIDHVQSGDRRSHYNKFADDNPKLVLKPKSIEDDDEKFNKIISIEKIFSDEQQNNTKYGIIDIKDLDTLLF
jgi:hypothetical protein